MCIGIKYVCQYSDYFHNPSETLGQIRIKRCWVTGNVVYRLINFGIRTCFDSDDKM